MKILFALLLFINIYAQNIELNLKQFAELVSSQHKVNIIINDEIQNNKFTFYVQRDKNRILLPAFKQMLFSKKLDLIYNKNSNFYYIRPFKPIIQPKKSLHTIKLVSLLFSDVKLIFEQIKDLKYSYIKNTNTVLLICTKKEFNSINKIIIDNDVLPKQFQLKITVIETNLNEAKNRGLEINSYVKSLADDSTQFFVNLITMPYTANTNVFTGSKSGFTSALHFLDSNGVSDIKSSPLMTVQSGKKISFSSVENIPYLSSSSSVKGASTSDTQNITYKDVGLKINLTPQLVNDVVFIDLNFVMESITDKTNLTPTTSKRELNNSFQLKKGQLLVLSGIVQTDKSISTVGIPILMKIPYAGQMFRYDRDISTKKSLSIMIEII